MLKTTEDELIVKLAKQLVGKQVNSTDVEQALELICRGFSFDCGMVYEMDLSHRLNLKEFCLLNGMKPKEGFSIGEIQKKYQDSFSKEMVTYLYKNENSGMLEREMLEFFSSSALAVASIVDDKTRIYGMIVLTNASQKEMLTKEELDNLSILLSMIGQYLGLRISQSRLVFAQSSLENILDNTGIDIYVNDYHTHDILYVNQSMAAPYGGVSQFYGRKCWQVLFPGQNGPCEFCPQKKLVDVEGNPTKTYNWDYQRAFDGSWFRVFSSAFQWVDGSLAHVVSSADITDNKRNEELVQYMANYDVLTNLPNRRKLIGEFQKLIEVSGEGDHLYLLFFDLDGFKSINDNLGHDAGDEFLVQLGVFLSEIPMLQNKIYRNGGDEFVALLGNDITENNIRSLVNFIHRRFEKPWVLKDGSVLCNTSVGVSRYPDNGRTAEVLLQEADYAMYHVKKQGGGGICFYHEVENH